MVRKLLKRLVRRGRKKTSVEEPAPPPTEATAPAAAQQQRKRKPGPQAERQARKQEPAWSLDDFKVEPAEDKARFHDFYLPDSIMHAIHDLGFEYCTPIQAKVFAYASESHNIAGRAQTGTGKTAAFLICILARFLNRYNEQGKPRPGQPRALVLAPTRELVIQIEKDAQALAKHCPLRSMAVYGGMDFNKQLDQLQRQPIDLIAATPGRLIDFMRRGHLDLKHIQTLVIDEADRMLDMGFIPDVSRIIRATPPKDRRQTMLFSATLTEDVLRLASQWMPDPIICEVDPEQVTVDTVKQVIYMVTSHEKFKACYNLLKGSKMDRVLIFCNRRDSTRRLADNLRRHGMDCAILSGAVDQEKRLKVLEGFRSGKIRIVVATDVAGRGLHVDNIDCVINYEFPYESEDYVHRIGRTGRAGVEGTAISFACEDESFVIPEIEEYIGTSLPCVMPEPELLAKIPAPSRAAEKPQRRGPAGGNHRQGGRGRPPRGGSRRR